MEHTLSTLPSIAASILANANALEAYFRSETLPGLGLGREAPIEYDTILKDPEAARARRDLVNDAKKLLLIALGPVESFYLGILSQTPLLGGLHALCHFKVPQTVPLNGEISLEDLAAKSGLDVSILTRFVRLAASNFVFAERRRGFVSHTSWSKLLARDERLRASIAFRVTEGLPSVAKTVEALEKSPEGKIAPFDLAFGLPFFEHKKRNPVNNANFANSMVQDKTSSRGSELAQAYPFNRLSGTMVDIGGGNGHMSVAIAKETPGLKIIVEDISQLKEQAEKYIADGGQSDNVTFVGHDFFLPQPESARGASAYFLSLVIHDWPDEKCRVIVKHIVEAMTPRSAILIYESLLPEPGQLLEYEESMMYTQDLTMFTLVAAKERSLADLQNLMSSVDDRLVVTSVVGPLTTRRSHLIEFKIRG